MSRGHRVVAAIDFGTHGTGYAWTTVSRDNDDLSDRKVTHFFQWKDQRALYAKNRTAVLTGPDGRLVAWGHEAVKRRDAAADPSLRLHTNFKMDLQTNLGQGLGVDDQPQNGKKDPGSVFNLVVMTLREVFLAACADILQGLYKESDIRWCVTVPAIWDQYTRQLMYSAAVAAGLPDDPDRLFLAQEPAAAALYCLAKGEERLRAADTRLMVIDAGGGTVDITSYLVHADGGLSELARPSGTKKGSEYLNQAFMQRELSQALGPERLMSIARTQRTALSSVLDGFEQEKLSFSADSADGLRLDLGAQLYQGLIEQWAKDQRGPMPQPVLVIEREKVVSLYEGVLASTLEAVDAHLAAMRAASGGRPGGELALLVGGFAQSPYLRGRLRERLAAQDVELVVPPRPELAVLSGAVHFAYDSGVFLTWTAPLTYGVRCAMPFRPGVDPESRREEGSDGKIWCTGRFDIFVQAGQAVDANTEIKKKYYPLHKKQAQLTMPLLSTERTGIEFADEGGVAPSGELVADLGASMNLPMEQREIEVTMHFGQSRIVATARNLHTGEERSAHIEWRPTW